MKPISPLKPSTKMFILAALTATAALVWATPFSGFLVNQTIAKGGIPDNINQQVQVPKGTADGDEAWQMQLQVQGPTDAYVQQLVVAPGGYSGWHSHPGLIIGTVISGEIDFYDANCQSHHYTSGQVFTENNNVHAIMNNASGNAELWLSQLIKQNSPRRIEADAPACAAGAGTP
jgi:quercetin dioxygenase-like cupin family protein